MAWTAGAILTAAQLNRYAPQEAVCQLVQGGTQSITNNVATAVTFATEDLDPLTWHSTGANTERVTPTIAGWYRSTFVVEWGSDTDYTRLMMDVQKNGAAVGAPNMRHDTYSMNTTAGLRSYMGTSPLIQMNGTTDYINLAVFQTNTSAAANTVQCRLLVELVYVT